MQIARTISSFRSLRRSSVGKVGFVPTMGALHEGHLSLLQHARLECDVVVASIFVNPKQFGPTEDFGKYPRVFDQDCQLLTNAKVDYLFAPSPEEMYPTNNIVSIALKDIPDTKEGVSRPGFFNGVALVVAKLFNIVQPDTAYFGQKDAIQCILLKNLVADFNFPIDLKVIPTLREADGLAMSSRNRYLNSEERALAPIFAKALFAAKQVATQNPERQPILEAALSVLSDPRIEIGYLSLASLSNGKEVDVVPNEGALLSGAIKIGSTRLIDNVIIELK